MGVAPVKPHRSAISLLWPWYGASALLFVIGVVSTFTNYNYYDYLEKAAELLVLGSGLFSVLLVRDQLKAQEKQLQDNHQQLVDDHQWRTMVSYHQLFGKGIGPCYRL